MKAPAQDLGRITLTVMFISGLMLVGFVVLRPFLPAILWATTLSSYAGGECSGFSVIAEIADGWPSWS